MYGWLARFLPAPVATALTAAWLAALIAATFVWWPRGETPFRYLAF